MDYLPIWKSLYFLSWKRQGIPNPFLGRMTTEILIAIAISIVCGVTANLLTDALKQAHTKAMELLNKIIVFLFSCLITACLIACLVQPFKTGNTFNVNIEQLTVVIPDVPTAEFLVEQINR